jgi:hypothetical protein
MLVFDFPPRSYGATAMSYRHIGLILDIDQEKLLDLGSCGDRLASRELVPFTWAFADRYDQGDVPYGLRTSTRSQQVMEPWRL